METTSSMPPVGGGQILEEYTWTQSISDVTLTKTITSSSSASSSAPSSSSSSPKVQCMIETDSLKVTFDGRVVLDKRFPYSIDAAASNWSIESGELLVDLCKRTEGFWERMFVDGTRIDIKTLGPKVGEVGKKADPNEPVKIEDPDMIAKVVKEHPELASGLAANMAKKSGNESLVTTKSTSATFTGKSSFAW